LFVLAFAGSLFAQTDTGSISGRVMDPTGAGVPGAFVHIRNLATTLQRDAVSDEQGIYQANLLPPGTYSVSADVPGFKRFVDQEVRIQVAQPTQLQIHLDIGSASDSVEVTASASLLNTESAAQGTVITQEKINALPLNGRQFIDLALLVPGTNA